MAVNERKVLFIGPSGVGKTRAVQELLNPTETSRSIKYENAATDAMRNNVSDEKLFLFGFATPSTLDWRYSPMGPVQFNIWEISGTSDPRRYNQGVDFCIIISNEGDEDEYVDKIGDIPYTIIRARDQLHEALVEMA